MNFDFPTTPEQKAYAKLLAADAGYVVGELVLFDAQGRTQWNSETLRSFFQQMHRTKMPLLEHLVVTIPDTSMCWLGMVDTLRQGFSILKTDCCMELRTGAIGDFSRWGMFNSFQLINPTHNQHHVEMFENMVDVMDSDITISLVSEIEDLDELKEFSEVVEWAMWLVSEKVTVESCNLRLDPDLAAQKRFTKSFWEECNIVLNKHRAKLLRKEYTYKPFVIELEGLTYISHKLREGDWLKPIPCVVATSTFYVNHRGEWFHCNLLASLSDSQRERHVVGNFLKGETISDLYGNRKLLRRYANNGICGNICQVLQIGLNAEAHKLSGSVISLD